MDDQPHITIQESLAPAPKVIISDSRVITTSLAVAEYFGKQHKDVLEKIRALIADCPPDFNERNFPLIQINIEFGEGRTRKDPAYEITRDGFVLLAMGFTGKRALRFKLAYIAAFNAMEMKIAGAVPPAPTLPPPTLPDLSKPVRAYINRVAHSMTRKRFEEIRDHITNQLRRNHPRLTDECELCVRVNLYANELEESGATPSTPTLPADFSGRMLVELMPDGKYQIKYVGKAEYVVSIAGITELMEREGLAVVPAASAKAIGALRELAKSI